MHFTDEELNAEIRYVNAWVEAQEMTDWAELYCPGMIWLTPNYGSI